MRMQLQDLEVFLAVAHKGTLAAAVDDLHRTPSALSKCIRRLEDALATELFDRSGARLRLSTAGERLQTQAQHLVGLARQLERDARAPLTRRVVLAGPSLLLLQFGPDLVQRFQSAHPRAAIVLRSMSNVQAAGAVQNGTADLALVSAGTSADGLEALEWGPLDTMLAGAASTVASGDTAPLGRLVASAFCGQGASIDHSPSMLADTGHAADIVADDLMVLAELVHSGLALAQLPRSVAERFGLAERRPNGHATPEEATQLLRRPGMLGWLTPPVPSAHAA